MPYNDIQALFNTICTKLPQIKTLNETRKKRLKKIYLEEAEHNVIFFKELFETVNKSNFLSGESEKGWKANFDWILKASNLTKILEGNYTNTETSINLKGKVAQHNFKQRNHDDVDYDKFLANSGYGKGRGIDL